LDAFSPDFAAVAITSFSRYFNGEASFDPIFRERARGGNVSDSMIGIKLADGSFYPILEEKRVGKKKLILTTARENQRSVQIDLYRGSGESLLEAVYIGSLVIENLNPKPAGSAEIELFVGISEEGLLNAKAGDKESGEYPNLSVSMDTIARRTVRPSRPRLRGVSAPDIVREEEDRPCPKKTRLYGERRENRGAQAQALLLIASSSSPSYHRNTEAPHFPFLQRRGPAASQGRRHDSSAATAPAQPALQQSQQPQSRRLLSRNPACSTDSRGGRASAGPRPACASAEPAGAAAASAGRFDRSRASRAPEGVWYKIVWGDTLWDISIAFIGHLGCMGNR
jgi:hypothetical protein